MHQPSKVVTVLSWVYVCGPTGAEDIVLHVQDSWRAQEAA